MTKLFSEAKVAPLVPATSNRIPSPALVWNVDRWMKPVSFALSCRMNAAPSPLKVVFAPFTTPDSTWLSIVIRLSESPLSTRPMWASTFDLNVFVFDA